jgi:hypothetical protein
MSRYRPSTTPAGEPLPGAARAGAWTVTSGPSAAAHEGSDPELGLEPEPQPVAAYSSTPYWVYLPYRFGGVSTPNTSLVAKLSVKMPE